ncbi:UbiA prenyltransferase family protein [bacterium]|nr:UbiA prenyltransferase family protein [bacterium]
MFKNITNLLKINHYFKNTVVFVPLLFSKNFTDIKLCLFSLIIFISFCLISSSVYILNDLIDVESDKKHPIKKYRPIPSGQISLKSAIFILIILFILSTLSALFVNIYCAYTIWIYFILNILYSLWLKKIPLIDALCIAIGFILRILSGCFAISVLPSPLVILMTFFLSNFFTFTKRKLEIELINDSSTRKSLNGLNVNTVNQFILINAILSISFYITYVLDKTTIEKVGSEYLYLTVMPFTLIIYRLFMLINTKNSSDDPITYIEKDTTLKYLFLFYFIIFVLIYTVIK